MRRLPLLLVVLLLAACDAAERAAAPALPRAALVTGDSVSYRPYYAGCRWTSFWDGQRITHAWACPDPAGRW